MNKKQNYFYESDRSTKLVFVKITYRIELKGEKCKNHQRYYPHTYAPYGQSQIECKHI